ncbi:MAG: phosphoribosylanthranilate isomerase [Anaerolineales bacterium]|nr:phosphoribosylanthranilate isomerase [Anaerolineales bacterium]
MKIQIYAFTDVDQALRAVDLGVDQIGFIAGDYGEVHAELSFSEARRLRDAVSSDATAVALTMATESDEIIRMAEFVLPDIVHISTDPDAVDKHEMADLRRRLPEGTELMKAIHVEGDASLDLAMEFEPVSDYLLLDTKVEGMPGVGATGTPHDWNISRRIVETVAVPVVLAGGLSPANVAEAIQVVRPWGVDSNTATNVEGDPVEKDMSKVAAFVQAVRNTEQ